MRSGFTRATLRRRVSATHAIHAQQAAGECPAEVLPGRRVDAEFRAAGRAASAGRIRPRCSATTGWRRPTTARARQNQALCCRMTLLERQRVGQQVEDAALQAFGRHHRGGIDARPALAVQPHLGPGVRLRLAHEQVAADRIPFAAEITGDDARRHAGGAHHRGVGRSEVAAEPALANRTAWCPPNRRWSTPGSSVYSSPLARNHSSTARAYSASLRGARAHLERQRARARIAVRRQPRLVAAARASTAARRCASRDANRVVAQRAGHRRARRRAGGRATGTCHGAASRPRCRARTASGWLVGSRVTR